MTSEERGVAAEAGGLEAAAWPQDAGLPEAAGLTEAAGPLIDLALREDLGTGGDLTAALLEPSAVCTARIVPRQPGVICGLPLIESMMTRFDALYPPREGGPAPRRVMVTLAALDGDAVSAGQTVATLHGATCRIVAIERTILNFLGRLSGVATLTRAYVTAARAANPHVRVFDTRKTTPGWRRLEKYAVRCGGGWNHRMGLYDAVLLKDNHLAGLPPERLAEHLAGVLAELRRGAQPPAFVEVEVDSLDQLHAVLGAPGVEIVLLDNFTVGDVRAALALRAATGRGDAPQFEVSGGVTLANIAELAATGVERIAVGALTHSAAGLDLGLDIGG